MRPITPILAAVWALASAGSGWAYTSQDLEHWDDAVKADHLDALYQSLERVEVKPLGSGDGDLRIHLVFTIYAKHEPGVRTAQQALAERIDVLIASLVPTDGMDEQTLDRTVESCRVEGAIETDEGNLGTIAVAFVPVVVVVG